MKKLIPNRGVVGAYELYESEKSADFVIELVGGGELFDIILERHMEGEMKEAEASSWVRQVLEALSHCHSKGIVHLDMKPENCLLLDPKNPRSPLKIADFGLATEVTSGLSLTEPTGTMEYAAPEVIDLDGGSNMRSKGYGYKADIWSVGVMLYIMLVGDFPYKKPAPRPNLPLPIVRKNKPEYKKLSAKAQSILSAMLQPHATRPTAAELIRHPWIQDNAPAGWIGVRKFRKATKVLILIIRLTLLCKGSAKGKAMQGATATRLEQIGSIWAAFRARPCYAAAQSLAVRSGYEPTSQVVKVGGKDWILQPGEVIDELETRYNMDKVTNVVQPRVRFLLNTDPSVQTCGWTSKRGKNHQPFLNDTKGIKPSMHVDRDCFVKTVAGSVNQTEILNAFYSVDAERTETIKSSEQLSAILCAVGESIDAEVATVAYEGMKREDGLATRHAFMNWHRCNKKSQAENHFDAFEVDGLVDYRNYVLSLATMSKSASGGNEEKFEFAFKIFDGDDSGEIDYGEFTSLMEGLLGTSKISDGSFGELKAKYDTPEKLTKMIASEFAAIDTDGSGTIEEQEFVSGSKRGLLNDYFSELAATLGGKLSEEPELELEPERELDANLEATDANAATDTTWGKAKAKAKAHTKHGRRSTSGGNEDSVVSDSDRGSTRQQAKNKENNKASKHTHKDKSKKAAKKASKQSSSGDDTGGDSEEEDVKSAKADRKSKKKGTNRYDKKKRKGKGGMATTSSTGNSQAVCIGSATVAVAATTAAGVIVMRSRSAPA
jgi:Ca2+-binding EF-hand superfamily protein